MDLGDQRDAVDLAPRAVAGGEPEAQRRADRVRHRLGPEDLELDLGPPAQRPTPGRSPSMYAATAPFRAAPPEMPSHEAFTTPTSP